MSRLRRLRVATVETGPVALSNTESHYASRVLRLRVGDRVAVFDGTGRVGEGVYDDGRVEVERFTTKSPLPVRLTLAVAPPKGERADWLVEKVSELGAARVVWLEAERSVAEANKKVDRHRRVAEAAARQSGQAFITELETSVPLDSFLGRDFDHRFIAHPGAQSASMVALPPTPQDVAVLVGPEAGFTDREVLSAEAAGYAKLNLARSILRIETAAVVATAFLLNVLSTTEPDESDQEEPRNG